MRKVLVSLFFLIVMQGCQLGAAPTDIRTGQEPDTGKDGGMLVKQLPFNNCPPTDAAVLRLVKSLEEWHELHIRKEVVGAHDSATVSDSIDFETHFGLLVMLGGRPTPGYALSLIAPGVTLERDVAKITFKVTGPEPGRIMAQVVTYPCALVRLPKLNYRSIQVHLENHEAGMLEIAVP